MNEQEIRHILKQGECETIEFKENFGKEAIQTSGAFANTRGDIFLLELIKKATSREHQLAKRV